MVMNDPLANVLSHVTNAERKGKPSCAVTPVSSMIQGVLRLLSAQNYVGDVAVVEEDRGGVLSVALLGHVNSCGVIKPRFSVRKDNYEKYEKRFLPARDFGVLIVSTSQGLMTHTDAKAKGLGGRLIAYCY